VRRGHPAEDRRGLTGHEEADEDRVLGEHERGDDDVDQRRGGGQHGLEQTAHPLASTGADGASLRVRG
jgi:hypothetical protein